MYYKHKNISLIRPYIVAWLLVWHFKYRLVFHHFSQYFWPGSTSETSHYASTCARSISRVLAQTIKKNMILYLIVYAKSKDMLRIFSEMGCMFIFYKMYVRQNNDYCAFLCLKWCPFYIRATVLYCTVTNMQVSLLGVYIRTRNMFTLQRGVRHDQQLSLYRRSLRRGERPQKLWG